MNQREETRLSGGVRLPAIWKTLLLPGGDRIVLAGKYLDGDLLSLHDANHNVYRLNPAGEVVWQVRRDDSIRPPDWWEALHRLAQMQGLDGKRKPFMYIALEYPDGHRQASDEYGDGENILQWERGCIIRLFGSENSYTLDTETGIATNVEIGPGRPW